MKYNKRFKELRIQSGLTQEKLAELMQLQTSNYISQIETEKKKIGISVINKFCKAIGINTQDFFDTEKEPVTKIKDLLTAELEKLPASKKDTILKCVTAIKDMDIEGIREILKHVDKEKLWEKTTRRKKSKAG